MLETIREAPIGQLIRWITNNKVLLYPEEVPGFVLPESYNVAKSGAVTPGGQEFTEKAESEKTDLDQPSPPVESTTPNARLPGMHRIATAKSSTGANFRASRTMSSTRPHFEPIAGNSALSMSRTREDIERQITMASAKPTKSMPIEPETLDDGTILVDWYATDDSANPQNWTLSKKLWATLIICIYTTAVYMGSSIYAPSIEGVMQEFNVSIQLASLGLSLYVLGYGLGPMIWSPLSEIPFMGRNPPYILTYIIFIATVIPAALVTNFPGLIVLRFLQGFFGSPCLATGGATLQDMFSIIKIPYVLCLWALAATAGPALGPIISGFSVAVEPGWRWSQYEILMIAVPSFISMLLFLPETNSATILLRRSQRLRQITGRTDLKSQSEIDQGNLSVSALVLENLYRPLQMMALDPAVGFTALYTALIYGIYYSFFESFPIVYIEIHGFNLGEQGLAFLSITVGVIISIAVYWTYIYLVVEPSIKKHGFGAPERRLIPALYATWLCPIGLFLYGWTARESIHWIVPTIGITIFTIGIFIIMQSIFVYLPFTYPQYAASLFAGNDLTRSALATGAIHFARPLFHNLGVARGSSLLGGLTAGCIGGLYALWYYGDKLRARSRFAAK